MRQRRTFRLVASFLIVAMLVLTGCQSAAPTTRPAIAQPTQTPQPTAAEPTSVPTATLQPTAASQAEQAKPVLTVGDKALTMPDLQVLEQISAEVGGKEYKGVRVLDVLKVANMTADAILMVASDGYSAGVETSALNEQSLLAYNDKGGVDAVLPGLGRGQWVREVVEISAGVAKKKAASDASAGEIVDAARQTVKLDKLPQRIVVVGRGPYMSLHLLYMFPEAHERLVGMEKKGSSVSDFLPLVDPDFGNKQIIEQNPGPEQVAALKPDLVIMKGNMVDKLGQSLAQVGIPTLYVWLETPDQFIKDVTNVGAVLGNPKRAKEIVAYYQERLDRLAKGTTGISEEQKPDTLLLEYSDRGGAVAVQVPAKPWIQTIEVETAGGAPVWLKDAEPTDGWTVVNFEQIAAWNPDKIFVIVWYTLDPTQVISTLKADAKWATLKAVQDGQIQAFPQDIFGWDSPEPRWILGMQWLATQIYPDRFADLNMTDELYSFFGEMYGMDKAAVDADIMPKVKLDVH